MLLAAASTVAVPIAKAADRMLGPRGCLFTFHRAAPPDRWSRLPNRNFYIDTAFLDEFLTYLRAGGWQMVTVEEAVRRSANAESGRYVNFSIDDCYRDSYELLAPLFRRHDAPLTLYVTTGIPDGTLPLWWAGLEDALLDRDRVCVGEERIELASWDDRRAAYHSIASSWDGPDAATHYAAFCRANGIDREAMHWKHAISWDMLEELARDPLIEIGAHTINHPRLSSLDSATALAELEQSRKRLNARLGLDVRHFAFPYGRSGDCGPRDFELARQAGFHSAATSRKGLVLRGQDQFSLPRNTINGAHRNLAAMAMHLTGLTGAAARIVGRV
ncbi:polysaccharide deacetylase family protein [Bradyrhizobium sp.]|uniref:polysaccharide deacetylase family protein n=1 Tax=Bradyrhizobium sp. TaxID=376 RepID=UPI0023820DDE|nr:polysaccharide deacetylase family protein [Bradyrhizobium sp.]MDE2377178.1 polysaccharide deacetylase family protein [Bradyrhizobium sp.]